MKNYYDYSTRYGFDERNRDGGKTNRATLLGRPNVLAWFQSETTEFLWNHYWRTMKTILLYWSWNRRN